MYKIEQTFLLLDLKKLSVIAGSNSVRTTRDITKIDRKMKRFFVVFFQNIL
jgi:hypothetical protein